MKQHLSPDQTAKLIELGYEIPFPKWVKMENGNCKSIEVFSIGELIEMLPENVAKRDEMPSTLNISLMNGEWCVQYADFLGTDFEFCNTELIDAICNMIVRLHEKGKI